MPIETLSVKNFQGITRADLTFGPWSVVYGLNGAGKTSLLDALHFSLTGEPARGATMGELVRQGARSLEVETTVDGRSIMRQRSSSKGEAFIDGVKASEAEMRAQVPTIVGASLPAISAALRSGALLELKPADLQQLLVQLTGASFDALAIEDALGAEVAAAAGRQKLTLPTSLVQFNPLAKNAEEERRAAKRELERLEEDFGHLASSPADIEARARGTSREVEQKHRTALQKRLDAARAAAAHDAGAHAARLQTLRTRVDELRAVPKPAQDASGLPELRTRLVRTDARAEELRRQIAAATTEAEEARAAVPAGEHAVPPEKEVADADAALRRNREALAGIEAEGKQLRQQIETAGHSATCSSCRQPIPPGHVELLEQERTQLRQRYERARELVQAAEADVAALREQAQAAAATKKADQAEARVRSLKSEAATLEQTATSLVAEITALEPVAQAQSSYDRAQAELQRVLPELARLEKATPPESGDDPAALEAELQRTDAVLVALGQLEQRRELTRKLEAARQAVTDCDLVAKALGPKGARVELLGRAVGPFLSAANEALAELAPGYQVEIDESLAFTVVREGARLTPAQLSDGERQRLLFVLQVAVARLSGVRFVCFDRVELLDDAGRQALKQLASACAADGIQVLSLSCTKPPEYAPAGMPLYVMQAGEAHAIPSTEAA